MIRQLIYTVVWIGLTMPIIGAGEPPKVQHVRTERLPPSTVLITDEASLRRAAQQSTSSDLNLLFDRKIVVTRQVSFPPSRSIVRLIGVNNEAAIHFDMKFDGNWRNPKFAAQNGLQFNCRQAILRGIRFSGFEWQGAAIKGHTKELLDVSDCDFVDIGTIQFPHKRTPPKGSRDTIYNQCVAAHEMTGGHVSIVNCRFQRCVLNNRRWSHCLYVSARSVLITGNRFEACGNAIAAGGKVPGASNNIFGNVIVDGAKVEDPRGRRLPTYLGYLNEMDSTVFMFNEVTGHYREPWMGHPNSAHQLIDFNNYAGMTYQSSFATDTGKGAYIKLDAWRSRGFDNHSTPPKKAER